MRHHRTVYRFADILFDPDEAQLLRGGQPVALQPKVHAALHLFLQRPLEIISKEELLGALWPGAHVSEEVLTQIIWKLRRALGDDPREPRFLGTVARRGYRLLTTPEIARTAAAPRQPPPTLAAAPLSPQPPNAAYDPDWYVARPAEERLAGALLAYPGLPVVVLAPQGFGKTWLLRHVLHLARAQGPTRVVLLSLDLFDADALASLDRFLRALAHHLAAALDLDAAIVERTWERSGNPQANLSWLLERVVLPPLQERGETLALCLDRADALRGVKFQDDVFGLLRAFAESGAEPPWDRLRLLLAVSTTPALLVQNPRQSPFNLTEPIRLGDLDDAQLRQLAALHQITPSEEELAALRALVGGHPSLCRVALYAARTSGRRLGALLAESAGQGVFAEHLEQRRARLARHPPLLTALGAVAQDPSFPLSAALAQPLLSAGYLLAQPAQPGCYALRYPLYRALVA